MTSSSPLRSIARWVNFIFMTDLDVLFAKGNIKPLVLEDLGSIDEEDKSEALYQKFVVHWAHILEKNGNDPKRISLWSALFLTIGYGKIYMAFSLFLLSSLFQFIPIIVLNILLRMMDGQLSISDTYQWLLVAALFVGPIMSALAFAHSNRLMAHFSAQVRNVLIVVIYRKALNLSSNSRQEISTGRIVTMFSTDTNQIKNFLILMNACVLAPMQILLCLVLLYLLVGVSMFSGVGFICVAVPFNQFVYGYVGKMRSRKMSFTDARIKLVNEVLNGIRIIKFYAWEGAFIDKCSSISKKELSLLSRINVIFSVCFSIMIAGSPYIQNILLFVTYVSLGNSMTTATAFTAITLFGLMLMPFVQLPSGIQQFSQASISINRIVAFLLCENLKSPVKFHDKKLIFINGHGATGDESTNNAEGGVNRVTNSLGIDPYIIKITKGFFSWQTSPEGSEVDNPSYQSEIAKSSSGEAMEGLELSSINLDDVTSPTNAKDSFNEDAPNQSFNGSGKSSPMHSTLSNLNLRIREGSLVAVIGSVGSGKSSLISAILGEMHCSSGTISTYNDVRFAYCDQRAWIVNATVLDNILFGSKLNEERFNRAVYSSCMTDDLKNMSAGVMTDIGERGINISGGQKARVALARAVYSNADVYLLDDPLSAVDAHVGEHIFQKCIREELSKKTRILVTHHVKVLPYCDKVIIMDKGTVKYCGTYEEIMRLGVDVMKYIPEVEPVDEHEDGDAEDPPSDDGEPDADDDNESLAQNVPSPNNPPILGAANNKSATVVTFKSTDQEIGAQPYAVGDGSSPDRLGENSVDKRRNNLLHIDQAEDSKRSDGSSSRSRSAEKNLRSLSAKARFCTINNNSDGKLMTKEEIRENVIGWDTYNSIVQSGGYILALMGVAASMSNQVCQINANFVMISWTAESNSTMNDGGEMSRSRNLSYFAKYAALMLCAVCFIATMRVSLCYHRYYSSLVFHSSLLNRVFSSPVAFFDVTPIGRIVNRFSQDLTIIDEDLLLSMFQVVGVGGNCVGSVGGMIAATKGLFLILIIPLICMYRLVYKYFRASNTTISRLEAVTRSPIYADFSQILVGTATVRAYKQEERYIAGLQKFSDVNTVPTVYQQLASQWLGLRLEFIGAIIICSMGILAVGFPQFIPAGYIGLALAYSIQLTTWFKVLVKVISVAEAQLNSVERCNFYINNLVSEHEELPGGNSQSDAATRNTNDGTPDSPVVKGDAESSCYRSGSSSSRSHRGRQSSVEKDLRCASIDEEASVSVSVGRKLSGKRNYNLVPRLPPTREAHATSNHPASALDEWPSEGKVEFRRVKMRYRNGPLVLKRVSCTIKAKEKVGICGRTGCGKSSLMVALFRIESLCGGKILIDGVDIATVPLIKLRSKLCIIPQDPVMFSASVRFNLDPFNDYSDAEVWDALSSVDMREHVASLPNKLNEMVSEGGDSFSAGQRQLVCIARALLRKPKILVMDEATASIDMETDQLIQRMIREKFKDCTVLTIAHRLDTIYDSDQIAVMDDGYLVEFGSAEELLQESVEVPSPIQAKLEGTTAPVNRITPNDGANNIQQMVSMSNDESLTRYSRPSNRSHSTNKSRSHSQGKGTFRMLWERHNAAEKGQSANKK